jgi:solute:Na+ symporter, SSS family
MTLPIVAFLLISFIIGVRAGGRIGGKIKNFYIAGNIIPFWVIALSLIGQAIELGGTQANATAAMTGGFWTGAVLPIGIGLSLVLLGLFYAKPLHKMRLLTLPDFYFRRYDKRTELIVSILCVISFIILLAGNLAGVGIILNYIAGIPTYHALIGIAVIITIYTIVGGLFAVTWNGILHVGVAIIGFVAASVWMINDHGPDALNTAIAAKFSWEPLYRYDEGALLTWASLLALGLGDIVALDFMERVFAAKTPQQAKVSCLLSGWVTIAIGVLLAFLGMMATMYMDDLSQDNVFLNFVGGHLPAGISMIVFMGLIGACISTSDGAIMACATVITKNLIQQHSPKLVPQQSLLILSRFSAVPVTMLAVIVAILRPAPGALLTLAFDVVFAGCLVPLTLGIYWKKANARAAFWSIAIPSVLRVVLHFVIPKPWAGLDTLIPPVVSLVIFVALSIETQKRGGHRRC